MYLLSFFICPLPAITPTVKSAGYDDLLKDRVFKRDDFEFLLFTLKPHRILDFRSGVGLCTIS